MYSQLHGEVKTKEWMTEVFKFLKGIAQGDNYSSIILLVIFQPLVTYLKSLQESVGYQLGERKIITKPFADDFETITRDLGEQIQPHLAVLICQRKESVQVCLYFHKLGLLRSYSVWVARRSPDWSAGNLLKPQSWSTCLFVSVLYSTKACPLSVLRSSLLARHVLDVFVLIFCYWNATNSALLNSNKMFNSYSARTK